MRSKHGTPLKFSLLMPATSAIRHKYSQLLQEQYRRLGAKLDIDAVDLKTYIDRTQPGSKAGDFDMAIQTFSTTDALIDSMSASFDPAKFRQYAKRAFQQIADDAPAIWLYDLTEVDAVNRRINVTKTRADGWWRTLAEWSIAPDKRIDRDRIPLSATPPAR